MAKKIKASLLGTDINLLENVAKRVVENRPAEVKYFTEVKDFLMNSMNEKPDIVAVSVNYPHKNAGQFPKVFKMALEVPVIAFGEDQETKTRKNLSITKADYKISGVLTAHNFWMKLANFQKKKEDDLNKRLEDAKKIAESKKSKESNIEQVNHLGELNKELDESVIKKSEFAEMMNQDENSIIDSLFAQIGDESKNKKKESQLNIITSDKTEKSKISSLDSSMTNETISANGYQPDHDGVNKSEDKAPSFEHIQGGSTSTKSSNNSTAINAIASSGKNNSNGVSGSGVFSGDGSLENSNDEKKKDIPKKPELAQTKNQQELKANNPLQEDGVKAPDIDEKGRVKLTDKNELQKREQEKLREKQKKEFDKLQNILKECCEQATKNILFSKYLEEPRDFSSTNISVFTVEMDKFKGFILFAESFNQGFEKSVLESLRSNIIELIKSKGYVADLSSPYNITIPESNYPEVVKESCEFTVYQEEEMGKQIAVSFLPREVTLPQYEDSDKEGMIVVDMKTIPPQTTVNFDAFIYLERNKRFVRYLKEGRSLSLKQVKRHIEGDVPCKLYLPKNDKGKLIQFFIQNTISWEFLSYNSLDKQTA